MNAATHDAIPTKAKETLRRVRAGMESNQVPMVTEIVQIIREITNRVDTVCINDLAEYISREPSTMVRIISIANSLGYNPSGAQITSVRNAIVVIGFERVRNLAISLLLLENAQSGSVAQTNRELASQALLSGLFAAAMCRERLSPDPELAFVCAALRSYGRMLLATFLAEDYAAAMRAGTGQAAERVYREAFGLTPIELGREVLSGMQLPSSIIDTLTDVPAEMRRNTSRNPRAPCCWRLILACASPRPFSPRT